MLSCDQLLCGGKNSAEPQGASTQWSARQRRLSARRRRLSHSARAAVTTRGDDVVIAFALYRGGQSMLLLLRFRQRTDLRIRQAQLDPSQLFEFVGGDGYHLAADAEHSTDVHLDGLNLAIRPPLTTCAT